MSVSVDGVRQGISNTLSHKRSVAAYLTGWGMIASGVITGDNDAHGVTIMAIGGVLVLGGLVAPYVAEAAESLADRLRRPDVTEELAEVEEAVHAAIAALDERIGREVRELREVVAGIRGQLR